MAGRSLGSLGAAHQPVEDLTFGYFGLVIRVHPNASDLELIEFLIAAGEVDEHDQIKGMLALGRYLKGLVHPDDWDAFWAASKGNRQTLTDLMQTAQSIVEAVSGFPTGQSSASPGGRGGTRTRSQAGSSSRRGRDQRRTLELLAGRPDMQQLVVLADETRAAAG